MEPAEALQAISGLLAVSADIARGEVPDPDHVARLLLHTANLLGASDQLRAHLTPDAVRRVDQEIEDRITAKFDDTDEG